MARKDHQHALTLERFAAGKDGRANAFKKKKQANKRKLFEKAQLKRQYAKLLKKEAADAGEGGEHEADAAHAHAGDAGDTGGEKRAAVSLKRKRKEGAKAGESKQSRGGRDDGEQRQGERGTKEGGQEQGKPGKWRRPEPRPDPFKAAKATAEQRKQEAEEKQRERARQAAEKEGRAKKRRKQHALLSKRTRGGQPVMKHTMQYLLEKIQSER